MRRRHSTFLPQREREQRRRRRRRQKKAGQEESVFLWGSKWEAERRSITDGGFIINYMAFRFIPGLSLGSGLIIFVSVLHDEFSLPLTSASSSASSAARTIGVGGGSWAVSSWQSAAFFNPGGATLPGPAGMTSSYGHQQPLVLLPSFRYGWAFYAALAAFVGSELAAALYILLHTRLFKWTTATKRTAQLSGQKLIGSSPVHRSRSKEAAVQTSPLSSSATLVPVMLDARQGRAITTDSHIRQHVRH